MTGRQISKLLKFISLFLIGISIHLCLRCSSSESTSNSPMIIVVPDEIEIHVAQCQKSYTDVHIANRGRSDLTVDSIITSCSWTEVNKTGHINIPEEDTVSIQISVDGSMLSTGEHVASLTLLSNDQKKPRIDVPILCMVDTMHISIERTLDQHTEPVISLCWTQNDSFLITGDTRTINIWDTKSWLVVHKLYGLWGDNYNLSCNSQSNILSACGRSNSIKLWDLTTWKDIKVLQGHTENVNVAIFSPDGSYLVSAGDDRFIKIWDCVTWDLVSTIPAHKHTVKTLAISRDGTKLASGSLQEIKIWNTNGWTEIYTLPAHDWYITSLQFCPDNRFLLSASLEERIIRVWDITLWNQVGEYVGHINPVSCFAFNPIGSLLVSGSFDTNIKVWNCTTRREIFAYNEHNNWINSVAFNYSGDKFASASTDRTVSVHRLSYSKY